MAKANFLVGLEIGTSKVCVVVASLRSDGALKIEGVGLAPSRGVRKGEIVDFETAGKCVHDALVDAEDKSNVEIDGVYVAITGSHLASFNNRGIITLPEEQEEIEESDLDDVRAAGREIELPKENAFMHELLQHYYVDGQEGVLNPVGMIGRRLEADFHIIHGIANRIKNSIRCVKEVGVEVEDVVFSGLAAAQVALTRNQKNLGALMIDIGGGTMEFVVYNDGVVKQSGVLAVGGDHITNDISMGLRIPMARAEKLKVDEGSVILGNCLPGDTISLKDDSGFAGKEIERETLNTIVHLRVRETFELLKKTLERANYIDYAGAGIFLTGGGSQIQGIDILAQEIFDIPAQLAKVETMAGPTAAFENPQFAVALGLIRYARENQVDRGGGWLSKISRKVPRLFGGFR